MQKVFRTFLDHTFALCKDSSRTAEWVAPLSVETLGQNQHKCSPPTLKPTSCFPTMQRSGGAAVQGPGIPGKAHSHLEQGWEGGGEGKLGFPAANQQCSNQPAHTHPHTHNWAESEVAFYTKLPQRLSPRRWACLCPFDTCVRECSHSHGKEMQLHVDNEKIGEKKSQLLQDEIGRGGRG